MDDARLRKLKLTHRLLYQPVMSREDFDTQPLRAFTASRSDRDTSSCV